MSDCEETDFFWESWTSPGKRKRKKKHSCVKNKNESTVKKKKKKTSKFKEAMEGKKEKKKERRKKKKSLLLGFDDGFIFTQGASDPVDELQPEASDPRRAEKPDHLTQASKKKTKRKKKVAFDLPPGYIHAKRPKLISSSLKELILPAVMDSTSCSQAQPCNPDSQCTSDDINSQDLFITQKTFRTVLSGSSSGEASDRALSSAPQTTQRENKVQPSPVVQKKHHSGSNSCPQRSRVQFCLTGEEDFGLAEQDSRRLLQFNTNQTVSAHVKPRVANPNLDHPVGVNGPVDFEKPKGGSCTSSCELNTDKPTASISTQTENFFTTELSSYLSFCQNSGATVCFDTLKPLDLSLPRRATIHLDMCLLAKMSGTEAGAADEKLSGQKPPWLPEQTRSKGHADPNLRPSRSAQIRELPDGTLCKSESPSPQSECEPKSADTTSGEDSEPPGRTGKLDLIQVRPRVLLHCQCWGKVL